MGFDKKGDSPGFMVAVLIIIFALVVILLFVPKEVLAGFWNIGILGGTSDNIEAVVNHCKLACSDRNDSLYCLDQKKPLPLRLGDGKVVEGSCAALSDVGFKLIEGVPRCGLVSCSNYPPAVCKIKNKVVDCNEF